MHTWATSKMKDEARERTVSRKESMMSTTLREESSTPSSASSADGLAPMSTSTAPTVVHCDSQEILHHKSSPLAREKTRFCACAWLQVLMRIIDHDALEKQLYRHG